MNYSSLTAIGLFGLVTTAYGVMPSLETISNSEWSVFYEIDRPNAAPRKSLPPPWKIRELAFNSARVSMELRWDGMLFFLDPGLDDGDNPLKLSEADTTKILAAVYQVLRDFESYSTHQTDRSEKFEDDSFFSLSVVLHVGSSQFTFPTQRYQIGSTLPPSVFDLIDTMRPFSPSWIKEVRK